jgi:hypothetical protein
MLPTLHSKTQLLLSVCAESGVSCAFDGLSLPDVFGVSLQESREVKLMPLSLILQDIQWVNLANKAAEIMSYVCLVCVGVGKKAEVDITDQVCKL